MKRKHAEKEGKDGPRSKRVKEAIAKEPVVPTKENSSKETNRPKLKNIPEESKGNKGKRKEIELWSISFLGTVLFCGYNREQFQGN